MAQPIPGSDILTSPIVVVGPQYCMPEFPMDLVIVKKAKDLTVGNLMVTDINEKVMFKLEIQFSFHHRRILYDPARNPVFTIRQKRNTLHGRCQVFRGDSHDKENLIFTAKMRSWVQFNTNMDVFLAKNKKEEVPDFSLEGNYLLRSCIIYVGDGQSKTILAQMHNNVNNEFTMNSILLGKHNFIVTVNQNVDYAFIVALMAILHTIYYGSNGNGAATAATSICFF